MGLRRAVLTSPLFTPIIMERAWITVPLVSAVLLAAVACQSTEEKEVSGRIVDVQAQSILLIDSLIIRDESGKEWTFNSFSQDVVGFSPSHLREHQAAGQPVTVFYNETSEGPLVVNIED